MSPASSSALLHSSTTAAPSFLQTAGALLAPVPTFTTEYYFTAQAADATSEWLATYTIQEVCTGDPATWTPRATPPNFITTVVTCDACATPTQTITCPAGAADQTGSVSIWGSGVTATATATPLAAVPGPELKDFELEAESSNTEAAPWWGGALLTQSISTDPGSSAPTDRVQTGDAASTWGNLALLSGVLTVAVGWVLLQ